MILPGTGRGTGAAGGGGSPRTLRAPEVYTARKLRRRMSLPEVLLWHRLRGAQAGVKFRRQHPIGDYVTDFYCAATRTVIEIDGEAHDRGDRPERDIMRDAFLVQNGYHIIHVAAAEVLRDPDGTAAAIAAFAANPLHQPPAGPPPRAGEDRPA